MDRRLPLLYIGLAALAATLALVGFSHAPQAEAAPAAAAAPGDPLRPATPAPAPRAATAAPAPIGGTSGQDAITAPRVETVLEAAWGPAPGQLGRRNPEEGNAEGPMSFEVDKSGRIVVLDQVNQRVQFFEEGQAPAILDLPADTFQDLTLDEDGNVVVLDRLARRSVETYGADGSMLHQIALEGDGVREGGGVTGLFQRPDGTWVEVEHSRVVRVADEKGNPLAERSMLPGRFSADGRSLLTAIRESPESAIVLIQPLAAPQTVPELLARVRFSLPIAHLLALESDPSGRVFLAATLILQSPQAPHDVIGVLEEVLVLGPDGRLQTRITLPARLGPEEQYRPIRLGADGALYQLHIDEHGARIHKVVI